MADPSHPAFSVGPGRILPSATSDPFQWSKDPSFSATRSAAQRSAERAASRARAGQQDYYIAEEVAGLQIRGSKF